MAKHRPRLNVFGRQLLVHRITDQDWPVVHAAEAIGVSRATATSGSAASLMTLLVLLLGGSVEQLAHDRDVIEVLGQEVLE